MINGVNNIGAQAYMSYTPRGIERTESPQKAVQTAAVFDGENGSRSSASARSQNLAADLTAEIVTKSSSSVSSSGNGAGIDYAASATALFMQTDFHGTPTGSSENAPQGVVNSIGSHVNIRI